MWKPILSMLVLLSVSTARGADTYPIRLFVPRYVGEVGIVSISATYKYSSHSVDERSTTRPVSSAFEAKLEGTETVQTVDEKGRPTKVKLVVDSCTKDGIDLLPKGTVIEAESVNGETVHTIDGGVPAPRISEALRELIYFSRPEYPLFSELFGSESPRKIGESWQADTSKVATAMHLPYKFNAEDLKAETKLTDVAVSGGQERETVTVSLSGAFDSQVGSDGNTYSHLKMKRDVIETWPTSGDLKLSVTGRSTASFAYTVVKPKETSDVSIERIYADTYKRISK